MVSGKADFFKYLMAMGFSAVVPAMAIAEPVVYECTFEKKDIRGGAIAPKIFVIYDANAGAVQVFDGYIEHFVGKPVEGKVTDETAKRIGFRWVVPMKNKTNQHTDMRYRLTYFKDGRPAQISAMPGGYDNDFEGTGSCVLGKS